MKKILKKLRELLNILSKKQGDAAIAHDDVPLKRERIVRLHARAMDLVQPGKSENVVPHDVGRMPGLTERQ